jgi:hypothetical protein
VFVRLDQPEAPRYLWWLSVDGIYRLREDLTRAPLRLLPPGPSGPLRSVTDDQDGLVHPKYHLPAHCFAYVGNAADTGSWHLPYLHPDGTPDLARLPKAIQAILSNYLRCPRQAPSPSPPFPKSW